MKSMLLRVLFAAACLGVTAANGALAQRFNVGKQFFAGLLAQHFAQQHAERTHIASQGGFLQVAGLRLQLLEPLRPTLGIPQKSHRSLIMHDGR